MNWLLGDLCGLTPRRRRQPRGGAARAEPVFPPKREGPARRRRRHAMVVEALVPPGAARVAIRIATRVATVYTNAPKRRRGAILADLCTLLTIPTAARATGRGHGSHDIDDPMAPVMPGRLGPEAHAVKAVARPIVWSFRTPSASWHRTRPWRWRCQGGPPYLGWCQGSL